MNKKILNQLNIVKLSSEIKLTRANNIENEINVIKLT